MRNVLVAVPKGSRETGAWVMRAVCAQPDAEHISRQFTGAVAMLGRSHPRVATVLDDARHDRLALAVFPQRHWRQI